MMGRSSRSALEASPSVAAELAQGELRALYLGWLLHVQAGGLDGGNHEPLVTSDLGRLSPSLESLAEFLRVDGDFLHVAAEASSPMGDLRLERRQVSAWVERLATRDKDELIASLMVKGDLYLVV